MFVTVDWYPFKDVPALVAGVVTNQSLGVRKSRQVVLSVTYAKDSGSLKEVLFVI